MQGKRATTSGTVKLVDFPQFMQKMRPYFVEKLGVHEAEAMVFRQQGDPMTFGTTDGSEKGLLAAGGQAGEALREIFPIPGLWYGPNYV